MSCRATGDSPKAWSENNLSAAECCTSGTGGLGRVSTGAMGCPGCQAVATHPGMSWQCSTETLEPLCHGGTVSAAGLLL